ncbi:hypothetical protein GCM10020000_01580 [Streptomyces olivoverticillatus]
MAFLLKRHDGLPGVLPEGAVDPPRTEREAQVLEQALGLGDVRPDRAGPSTASPVVLIPAYHRPLRRLVSQA